MKRSATRIALAAPAVLLLLAACSSTRPPSGGAGDHRAERGGGAAAQAGGRGGRYYLDDGPGDALPADLDSIPNAVPRAEPLNPRTARPYVVFDRQYVPMAALAPYRERGIASWYGRRYHGRPTSSGEVYDMYAMTAAHPTLPIPSYVRVTHLRNGRSVVVRVNDRGPFLNDRLIDLSYAAAAKLGYVNAGSAEVEVELITRFDGAPRELQAAAAPPARGGAAPADDARSSASAAAGAPSVGAGVAAAGTEGLGSAPARLELETVIAPVAPAPAAAPAAAAPVASEAGASPGIYLQLGAFSTRAAAESARARYSRDLAGLLKEIEVRQEGALFKLHAGPYTARADALAAAQQVERTAALRPVVVAR